MHNLLSIILTVSEKKLFASISHRVQCWTLSHNAAILDFRLTPKTETLWMTITYLFMHNFDSISWTGSEEKFFVCILQTESHVKTMSRSGSHLEFCEGQSSNHSCIILIQSLQHFHRSCLYVFPIASYVKTMSCGVKNLGFWIRTKHTKFVEDHKLIIHA